MSVKHIFCMVFQRNLYLNIKGFFKLYARDIFFFKSVSKQ